MAERFIFDDCRDPLGPRHAGCPGHVVVAGVIAAVCTCPSCCHPEPEAH